MACISIVATASSSSETASGSGETATSPSHISTSRGSTHTADDTSSSDTTQTSNGSLSSDQNASTLPFLAHPGVSNDNFRCVMSSRRFESLLQFIHINDSRKQPAAGEPCGLGACGRPSNPTERIQVVHGQLLLRCRSPTGPVTVKNKKLQKGEVCSSANDDLLYLYPSGDQLITYYGFPHRTVKWWKRLFHIIDVTMVNAHILHNATAERRLTQLELRIAVAQGLHCVSENVPSLREYLGLSVHLHSTKYPRSSDSCKTRNVGRGAR